MSYKVLLHGMSDTDTTPEILEKYIYICIYVYRYTSLVFHGVVTHS